MLQKVLFHIAKHKYVLLVIALLVLWRKYLRLKQSRNKRKLQRELDKNKFFKKKSLQLSITKMLSLLPKIDEAFAETILHSDIPTLLKGFKENTISTENIIMAHLQNLSNFKDFSQIVHEVTIGKLLSEPTSIIHDERGPTSNYKYTNFYIPFLVQDVFDVKGFDSGNTLGETCFRPALLDHYIVKKLGEFGFIPMLTSRPVLKVSTSETSVEKEVLVKKEQKIMQYLDVDLLLKNASKFAVITDIHNMLFDEIITKRLLYLQFSLKSLNFNSGLHQGHHHKSKTSDHPIAVVAKFPKDLKIITECLSSKDKTSSLKEITEQVRYKSSNELINLPFCIISKIYNAKRLGSPENSMNCLFKVLETKGYAVNLIETVFFETSLKLMRELKTLTQTPESNPNQNGTPQIAQRTFINDLITKSHNLKSTVRNEDISEEFQLLKKIKNLKGDFETLWQSINSSVMLIPFYYSQEMKNSTSQYNTLTLLGGLLSILDYSYVICTPSDEEYSKEKMKDSTKEISGKDLDSYFIISRAFDEKKMVEALEDMFLSCRKLEKV